MVPGHVIVGNGGLFVVASRHLAGRPFDQVHPRAGKTGHRFIDPIVIARRVIGEPSLHVQSLSSGIDREKGPSRINTAVSQRCADLESPLTRGDGSLSFPAGRPALPAIISSMAISNLTPMSMALLVSTEKLARCPMALVLYFRQAPDRGLCFGAEEMVPRE
jgi:hypothetical protein